MAGVILGLAFLVALAAAKSAQASTAPASPHASVQKIVSSGDPRKMLAAASALHAAGDPASAKALTDKARDAAAASPTAVYPSPLPTIATPEWSAFVHAMRTGRPDEVTPANYLGMFQMGMPRLVDLKLATNPRKVKHNGRSIWIADWVPELQPGPDKFLASPALQYGAFRAMVLSDLNAIHAQHPQAIGSEIDGVRASASGLLAVSKQAGVKGLGEWLASADVRAKFPHTTAAFHKTNGFF